MIEKILIDKLRGYLGENNPDVLLRLQEGLNLTGYLEGKVALLEGELRQWAGEGKPRYIIEELAMQRLTEELRPSKYLYVKEVFEEEFATDYERFREMGVLTYEIINMLSECTPVFEAWGFGDAAEDDRLLRYEITGVISGYLEGNKE